MRYTRAKKPSYKNTEQILKSQICKYLSHLRDCVVRHYPSFRMSPEGKSYFSPFMPPGMPDLIVAYRERFLAIEVKRPAERQLRLGKIACPKVSRGRLSPHQEFQINLLRSVGVPVLVAYSLDDVHNWIREIDQQIESVIQRLGRPPGARIWPITNEGATNDPIYVRRDVQSPEPK